VNLSFTFASCGMISVKFTPGMRVGMGLNALRILSGTFSFGSQRSMCDGPPCRYTMMTLLALPQPGPP